MIKLPELRIGNKAHYFEVENTELFVGTVDGINGYDSLVVFLENNNVWGDSNIGGIPLTPEILEKCGFEPAEESPGEGWYEIPVYRDMLQVCPRLEYPIVCIKDEHDTQVILDKVTIYRYLHQLQNLYFALTGQELEVKL